MAEIKDEVKEIKSEEKVNPFCMPLLSDSFALLASYSVLQAGLDRHIKEKQIKEQIKECKTYSGFHLSSEEFHDWFLKATITSVHRAMRRDVHLGRPATASIHLLPQMHMYLFGAQKNDDWERA